MIRREEIKDIVAKENGYKDWKRSKTECDVNKLEDMYNEVCDRYAKEVAFKAVCTVLDDGYSGIEDYEEYIELL